ncbi:unnamed protein product [Phaedon cochleariae]|uniref:E3 ubiquitin-protein ligase Sina-like RING finger domain-containing protein n=1 Tax=Phaedon cochleariae TaxID=80249 RepID=A0A9P0GUK8_PHACE|nr:unnamed protein product [Phaedon cochleariae]
MATVALLENEVKYMRCTLCDHFLSVPPIMTISDDGKENQCGRCRHIKSAVSKRNFCYENLARFLNFPCIYRNCPEQVQWNEVEQHEKNCVHKAIQCPLYYQKNCTTIIEINEFELHMNRLHRNNTIYGDTVSKKIGINMSSVYYLVPEEGRFLVYITPEAIFVGSLGAPSKYFTYSVKMTAMNNCEDKCLFFDNVRIVEYEERLHCFRCLKEKCNLIHHQYSKHNNENTTKNADYLYIDKDLVTKFLQDTSNITISLTLIRESENAERNEETFASAVASNTSLLRRYLRCAVCGEYMMSKVFRCEVGHMFCGSCESRVGDCNVCGRQSRSTRYQRCQMAEELASCVLLCCLGRGCDFIGGLKEFDIHEQNCCLKRED